MSLLMVPYNNAMRLGQGFNSLTHEICIDDAVVVSPQQPENVLTNDGMTMRLSALVLGKPSLWTKQEQILLNPETFEEAKKNTEMIEAEKASGDAALLEAAEAQEKAAAEAAAQQELDKKNAAALGVQPVDTGAATEPSDAPADDAGGVPPSSAPEAEAAAPPAAEKATTEEAKENDLASAPSDAPADDAGGVPPSTAPETEAAAPPAAEKATTEEAKENDLASAPSDAPADGAASAPQGKAEPTEDNAPPVGDTAADTAESLAPGATTTAKGIDSSAEKAVTGETNESIGHAKEGAGKSITDGEAITASNEAGDKAESAPLDQSAGVVTPSPPKALQASPVATADEKALADAKEAEEQVAAVKAAQVAALKLKRQQADLKLAEQRRSRRPEMLAAADKFKINLSVEKMAAMHKEFLLPKMTHSLPKIGQETQVFNIKNSTGVSQTVIFQSRLVEKLSDITSDLGVSAALSIKKGSVGGAGSGSYVDTDSFRSSDLNYFLSVRVVNQSMVNRDYLEFQPLPNIGKDDFRSVFGDSFISGFLEGGELSALISMKIINKAKATDIKVAGSVALGKGSLDVTAKGAFMTAKTNLDLNTKTTIQVSWSGGGVIKPPEEAWTIESLARAANRFPDHVAQSPQRTWAILTKYEVLRSYQALKPPEVTPIDYENAALYTNELMDTFMAYKAIYNRLTAQIGDVENGILKFKKTEGDAERKKAQEEELSDTTGRSLHQYSVAEKKAAIGFFPSSLDGLDNARRAVRTQMNYIINQVDTIANDPSTVLDETIGEMFLPSFAFESLLPMLEPAFRAKKGTAPPLSGEKYYGYKPEDEGPSNKSARMCYIKKAPVKDSDSASESKSKDDKASDASTADKAKSTQNSAAITQNEPTIVLLPAEDQAIDKFLTARDEGIEDSLRLTPPMGNEHCQKMRGTFFSALDFIQPSYLLRSIKTVVREGVIAGLWCKYTNGLFWKRGLDASQGTSLELDTDERITSIIVTVGTEAVLNSPEYILSLKFITNRGKSLLVADSNVRRAGYGRRFISGRAFSNVRSATWESPLERGYVCGLWGWSDERGNEPGIYRLGVVWANQNGVDVKPADDTKKIAALQIDQAQEEQIGEAERLAHNLADSEKKIAALNELTQGLLQRNADSDTKIAAMTDEKSASEKQAQDLQQQIKELETQLGLVKAAADEREKDLREEVSRAISEKNAGIDAANVAKDQAVDAANVAKDAAAAAAILAKREAVDAVTRSKDIEISSVTKDKADAIARVQQEKEAAIQAATLHKNHIRNLLIGGNFAVRHWSGKVLDHMEGDHTPIIYDEHRQWNQRWRVWTDDSFTGIRLYTRDGSGRRWCLHMLDGWHINADVKKVECSLSEATTFNVILISGESERWPFALQVQSSPEYFLETFAVGAGHNGAWVVAHRGNSSYSNRTWRMD